MNDIVSTYGDIQALEEARKSNPGKTADEIRQTKEYQTAMKSFGIGSQAQMAVQAIAGVLGGIAGDSTASATIRAQAGKNTLGVAAGSDLGFWFAKAPGCDIYTLACELGQATLPVEFIQTY